MRDDDLLLPGGPERRGAAIGRELELESAAFRRLVGQALERIGSHLDSLPEQPSWNTETGAELARSLQEKAAPEEGTASADLLDLLFDRVVPVSFNTAGPGYFAYIPGGGLPQSGVADLIADCVNRYVGVWAAAPGLAQIEANVVSWFCEIVGYPTTARGILTSGGSLANFSAVVTARRDRLPEDFLKGTIYTSDQTHHSVRKAAILAGFPESNVREIPSDELFRIRLDALEESIERDRASGFDPFLVVGSAGTTNTGAVDDLSALAGLCERGNLWFHVDAAYGGFFLLAEAGRKALRGIDRADSIVLDPHKGLFLPYGTGSLLVRNGTALKRAHALGAEYLPAMQSREEFVDFCELSPELSRDWRGLRVWLPVKMHGLRAFRDALAEKLDLARWACAELRRIPRIEIVAEPQLSILAFRISAPGADEEENNRINHEFLERINARKRVYLTGTTVNGRFVVRICVISFRTHLDRMREAIENIRDAAAESFAVGAA
ncbi:MAG: pyridoxal phosphate-dependent decarboxylase family protein [Thermoanaerobaculia bacterium]